MTNHAGKSAFGEIAVMRGTSATHAAISAETIVVIASPPKRRRRSSSAACCAGSIQPKDASDTVTIDGDAVAYGPIRIERGTHAHQPLIA